MDDIEIILQPQEVSITEPMVSDYVLPKATATVLGGIKVGNNLSVASDGTLSSPIASESTAGVIKIGNGLSIDDSGVVTATSSYTLPQATKTTLGGVYVDDTLSDSSYNPIENRVIATNINSINSDINNLSDEVDGVENSISIINSNVSGLSSTVTNLSSSVTANTNSISTINSSLTAINNRISGVESTVTNQGNAIADMTNTLNVATSVYNEVILFNETDNGTWSGGQVRINRRGKVGTLTSTLEGTASALTIPSHDEVVIATISDSNEFPIYSSYASIFVGNGFMQCRISTSGEFIIENNTTSSVTIDRVIGTIPIIFS